jgi:dolichyl-phosphate-mannose-protein mannosyltransferase
VPSDAPVANIRPASFWTKVVELHTVMWDLNGRLTDIHEFGSRPSSWPLLNTGISFVIGDDYSLFLIGNPIIWWTCFASILIWSAIQVALLLREQRGYHDTLYGNNSIY